MEVICESSFEIKCQSAVQKIEKGVDKGCW